MPKEDNMKNYSFFSFFIIAILLFGCSGSPMKTGAQSERHRINMMDIKRGMSREQVFSIMGRPYRKEFLMIENQNYEVWFYMTKGTTLGQYKLVRENLTPVIFKDGSLEGWGYHYYDYLLDIDNKRKKLEEEKRQQYTDNPDEWPAKDHRLITPPTPQDLEKAKKEQEASQAIEPNEVEDTKPTATKDEEEEIEESLAIPDKSSSKQEDKTIETKDTAIKEPKIDSSKKEIQACPDKSAIDENYNMWE